MFFANCMPNNAPMFGLNPGNNEINAALSCPAMIAFPTAFLSRSMLSVSYCIGIFSFSNKLIINVAIPKSPLSSGNSGSLIGNANTKSPVTPARRKTTAKQKTAARKNLVKARKKWSGMTHKARKAAMPNRKRKTTTTKKKTSTTKKKKK